MDNAHKRLLVDAANTCLQFGYQAEHDALIEIVVDEEMKRVRANASF